MDCYGLTEVGSSGVNADRYHISQDKKIFALSDEASGSFEEGCRNLFSLVNEKCPANKLDDKTIIVAYI